MRRIPLVFPLPDQGDTLLQPLWIEDLANILTWSLDNEKTKREIFEMGGPEQLSFRDIVISMADVMEHPPLSPLTQHIIDPHRYDICRLSIPENTHQCLLAGLFSHQSNLLPDHSSPCL